MADASILNDSFEATNQMLSQKVVYIPLQRLHTDPQYLKFWTFFVSFLTFFNTGVLMKSQTPSSKPPSEYSHQKLWSLYGSASADVVYRSSKFLIE